MAFRQCLANAINNADAIRLMLQPRYRVVMANFWQFANEYWGMARGYPHKNEPLVKQANYLVFELINRHLGRELIAAEVRCNRFSYAGGTGVCPCVDGPDGDQRAESRPNAATQAGRQTQAEAGAGRASPGVVARVSLSKELGPVDPPAGDWQITQVQGVRQTVRHGVLAVTFAGGKDINYFHAKKTMPAKPRTGYRVKMRARTIDLKGGAAGIQVGDARGWVKTHSCAVAQPLQGTTEWTTVVAEYATLADTTEIEILARRLGGKGPVSGRAEFGEITIEMFLPDRVSALPELTALASRTPGTSPILHLLLVCKRLGRPLPVRVSCPDGYRLTNAECLTGPKPWSSNLHQPDTVKIVPLALSHQPMIETHLRPCSLTGLRFEFAE